MSETTTITFEGLKGVGNVELNLRADQRVYAFIGTNGVGKTKVLEGLFQAEFLSNQKALEYAAIHFNSYYGFFVFNTISHKTTDQTFTPSGGDDEYFPWHKLLQTFYKTHDFPVVMLGSNARSKIDRAKQKSYKIGTFEDRRVAHFDTQIAYMTTPDDFSSIGMGENISEWFVSRAQSANDFQEITDNRKIEIEVLLKTLAKIDSRFNPAPTSMKLDGANTVTLSVDGIKTELNHLSSGFASVVKMLQAIIAGYANFTNETNITHVKGIVLIDEIESHLHVEWQAKIISLLKTLFPNTTFYVATHSPIVLSQLAQGEAYVLKRDSDSVVRSVELDAPNRKGLYDVVQDGLDLNLNQIKIERTTPDSQTQAKRILLELLNEEAV